MSLESRKGALYVAFGPAFLAMALYSAASLRKRDPSVGIALMTNQHPSERLKDATALFVDRWLVSDLPNSQNRGIKTRPDLHTPFEETVYLDCDTIVLRPLDDLFLTMQWFDVGARLHPHPRVKGNEILGGVSAQRLPHWNGGVVAFRSTSGATALFQEWHKAHRRLAQASPTGKVGDQWALVEAVCTSPARFVGLDLRWNCQLADYLSHDARIEPSVLHYKSDLTLSMIRDIASLYAEVVGASLHHSVGAIKRDLYRRRRSGPRRVASDTIRRVQGLANGRQSPVPWKIEWKELVSPDAV